MFWAFQFTRNTWIIKLLNSTNHLLVARGKTRPILQKAGIDRIQFNSHEIEFYRQYKIDTSCDRGKGLTATRSEQLNATVSGQRN